MEIVNMIINYIEFILINISFQIYDKNYKNIFSRKYNLVLS